MSRVVGRAGGASAGIIAVLFGVLELLQKTPPPWVVIGLGVAAVVGVAADYLYEQRNADKPAKQQQRQRTGKDSNALQAGGNISGVGINTDVPKANE